MPRTRTEMDPAFARVIAAIDHDASVPVSVQLRGALEFGVSAGELKAGQRLPSVRLLAKTLGISPVTVSNVYSTLQSAGHVEGRAGSGTFVSATARAWRDDRISEIDTRIAELVVLGQEAGLTRSDIALRVSMSQMRPMRPVRVLMVGNFHDATEAYAADIRDHLPSGDTIEAVTLDELAGISPVDHDLIVAPRIIIAQIAELNPDVNVVEITLIPNEATRVALAGLRPETRVVGFSYMPGFVTIMKTGIQRFAPHIANLEMVVRGDKDAATRIAGAQVVIYATGADYLLDELRPDQSAFEYRHTPDARSIHEELLPAIESSRHTTETQTTEIQKDAAE